MKLIPFFVGQMPLFGMSEVTLVCSMRKYEEIRKMAIYKDVKEIIVKKYLKKVYRVV